MRRPGPVTTAAAMISELDGWRRSSLWPSPAPAAARAPRGRCGGSPSPRRPPASDRATDSAAVTPAPTVGIASPHPSAAAAARRQGPTPSVMSVAVVGDMDCRFLCPRSPDVAALVRSLHPDAFLPPGDLLNNTADWSLYDARLGAAQGRHAIPSPATTSTRPASTPTTRTGDPRPTRPTTTTASTSAAGTSSPSTASSIRPAARPRRRGSGPTSPLTQPPAPWCSSMDPAGRAPPTTPPMTACRRSGTTPWVPTSICGSQGTPTSTNGSPRSTRTAYRSRRARRSSSSGPVVASSTASQREALTGEIVRDNETYGAGLFTLGDGHVDHGVRAHPRADLPGHRLRHLPLDQVARTGGARPCDARPCSALGLTRSDGGSRVSRRPSPRRQPTA